MRRMLLLAIALILLMALCTVAAADTAWYGVMMVEHCEEWVSLREAPDTASARLAQVPLYALVTDATQDSSYEGFTYCCYEGQYGYILSRYLEVWMDPEPDPETEQRYTSDAGFSFIFEAAALSLEETMSEDAHCLMLQPIYSDEPVYLKIMSTQSLGMTASEYLEANAPAGAEYERAVTEDGSDMRWFRRVENAVTQSFYAVNGENRSIVAEGIWPSGADGEWGQAFDGLLRTVRFEQALPVRADWAEATPRALVIDDDGEYVTLMADEPVTDVQLLALTLKDADEDGNVTFDTDVLFRREAITGDAPLVVKLAFPGDIPSYGLRFTDATGRTRQFAIAISGRDGTLILVEF